MSSEVRIKVIGEGDARGVKQVEESIASAAKAAAGLGSSGAGSFKQLQDAVDRTGGSMGSLKDKGSGALDTLKTKAHDTGGVFDGWLGRIAKIGLATAGAGAILGLGTAIASAGSDMLAGNAQVETYNTQLATLMGSAEGAKERMAELGEFGAKTPFELPQLVEAEKVMIGFGLTTGKSMDLAKLSASDMRTVIGDVAAGTGKDFAEIALTFGKFSAGATGEAISRLQELGVVTREELAAQGVEFSKSGQLISPLPVAFEAATRIAKEKFGGGMNALSNTFEGKMSTLSDTWSQIKRAVAAPLFDVAKAGLDAFLPMLTDFATKASEVSSAFQEGGLAGGLATFEQLTGVDLVPLVDGLRTLLDVGAQVAAWLIENRALVGSVVAALGTFAIIATVVGWIGGLVASLAAVGGAVAAAGGGLTGIVAILGGPVTLVIAAVAAGVAVLALAWQSNFLGIQDKVAAFVSWWQGTVAPAIDTTVKAIQALIADLSAKWQAEWRDNIQPTVAAVTTFLVTVVVPRVQQFVQLVGSAIGGVVGFFREHWGSVQQVLSGVWQVIIGIVRTGAALIGGIVNTALALLRGDWKGAWESAKQTVVGVWNGIMQILGGIGRYLDGLVGIVKAAAVKLGLALLTGVKEKLDQLWHDFTAFWDRLRAIDLSVVGKAIIDGLRRGVDAAWTSFVEGVTSKFRGLIDTAMSVFDSHSPSRVFMSIGIGLILGLALGITSAGGTAEAAMRDTLSKLNGQASVQLANLEAQMRQHFVSAMGPGGVFDEVRKIWENKGEYGPWYWIDVNALIASGKLRMPDPTLMTGDLEAARQEWERFWNDIVAIEDRRAAEADAYLTRQSRRFDAGGNETMSAKIEEARDREKNRHSDFMKMVEAQKKAYGELDSQRQQFQQMYDRMMEQARSAIRTAQEAQEQREDLIHAGVMEHIDQQAKAWEQAHTARLAALGQEKAIEDARHQDAMSALAAERSRWDEYLAGREAGVKRMDDRAKELGVQLGRLKLDLNIEGEQDKLAGLEAKVQDFLSVLGNLSPAGDPRKAREDELKRAREKIQLTTAEQRKALEAVKGTLTGGDLRTAELLLQGHALKAQTVRDLMSKIADQLKAQASAQQGVLDGKQAQVDALQLEINTQKQLTDEAKILLDKEKERVGVILAGIADRETAENARNAAELARISGLVSAENSKYELQKRATEALRAAEADRHTYRMRQIAEEYALELARLQYSQEEIAAMTAAAAEQARQIGEEAARLFAALGSAGAAAFDDTASAGDRAVKATIYLNEELKATETVLVRLGTALDRVAVKIGKVSDELVDVGKAVVQGPLGGGAKTERNPGFSGKRYRSDGTYTGAYSALLYPDGPPKPGEPKGPAGESGPGGIFKRIEDGAIHIGPILQDNIATPMLRAYEYAIKLGDALKALPQPPPGSIPVPGPGGPGTTGMGHDGYTGRPPNINITILPAPLPITIEATNNTTFELNDQAIQRVQARARQIESRDLILKGTRS